MPGSRAAARAIHALLFVLLCVSPIALSAPIVRIELEFDQGRTYALVPAGGALTVSARISHQGVGLLTGAWEVASPPASLSVPVFVVESLVQQSLHGAGETVIVSPSLPTEISGAHVVKFRVDGWDESPTLRYQVAPR